MLYLQTRQKIDRSILRMLAFSKSRRSEIGDQTDHEITVLESFTRTILAKLGFSCFETLISESILSQKL